MNRTSLIIGGALALAFTIVAACATGQAPQQCASGQTLCGTTVCADLTSDPDNCGACNTQCPTANVCVAGACAQRCPSGNTLCEVDGGTHGTCVDTSNDNLNCGKCGNSCGTQSCANGECSSPCSKTATSCTRDGGGTFCTNTKTDQQNCGACGTPCVGGQLCSNGMCVGSCTSSQTTCMSGSGNYCAEIQTDNDNCGACGTTCGLLQTCVTGTCVNECDGSQTICNADAGTPSCVDTLSDNKNCGACNNACPSNKPVCSGGTCSSGNCNFNALVLGDGVAASNSAYQTLLQNVGFTVTVQSSGTTTYSNSPAATGFGVIIVTPGSTYTTDMPSAGQTAIVNAVNGGASTGVIFTEWAAYMVTAGFYSTLKSIELFTRSTGTTSTITFTNTTSSPIWNGLPSTFTTSVTLGGNVSGTLATGAVEVASSTQCGIGVASKDSSSTGRVVQIAHAAAYMSYAWYNDTNLTKMMANAALWAARCD